VRARALVFAVLLGAASPQLVPFLAAQDVTARLSGRVPPDVVAAVTGIAQEAADHGLPVEPLIQKTLEGSAKGVPGDRVILAVRTLADRLGEAQTALRNAGIPAPSPAAVEGGADALNAGLNASQVRDLGRVSRAPYDPAVTLRVATTLTALGVPANQGLRLMERMIQAGRAPNELLDLPNAVQVDMAEGASAAQAAEGLEHGEDAHGPEGEQGRDGGEGQHGQDGREP
jgi:hypothetical protein